MQRSITNKALVSAIAYMDTREINPNIIDTANEAGFDDIMMIVKRYKKTDQGSYHHFVNEDLFRVLTFDAGGVAGSGTATLTVTITTTGFIRRDNAVKFQNGKQGKVNSAITTAGGKDSFTIVSTDGSNLTAADGDKISVIGMLGGEKSDSVQNLSYGQTKYFNLLQTMKEVDEITDIQKAAKVETESSYAYIQMIQKAQSLKTQISAALIGGTKSVNEYGTAAPTLTDQNGNSVQTTGGLDQEVTTYGVDDTVATPGTVIMADVDDLCDRLIAVKAPTDYLCLSPDSAWRKYDDMTKNLGSSGVTSARLNMDGKEVNYNISKFTKGKFSFEFGSLAITDHPQLFNFAGASNISKNIYGIPKGNVKTQGAGGSQPRIGVRYFPNQQSAQGHGTDIIQELYTGGLAPHPTSAVQKLQCDWTTHQGLEALGTRQMFKQLVLA